MAKIIQCSDLHLWKDMSKLEAIKDHSNNVHADAVFMLGDLIEGIELVKRAHQKGIDLKQFSQLDSFYCRIKDKQTLEQMLEQSQVPKESRNGYRAGYDHYHKLLNVMAGIVVEESRKVYKSIDQVCSQLNAPVYALPGNHDPLTFYEMKNIKPIDQTGSFNIQGVNFLGSINSYEHIRGLPISLFPHLLIDPAKEQLYQLAERYEKMGMGKKEHVLKEMIEKNPEYQRIMQNEVDYLLTHKGIDEMAIEGNQNYGAGAAISAAVNKKNGRIKAVLGGHVHNYNIFKSNNLIKIRSAPNVFYEIDIGKDKEIKNLQIYQI